MQNDQGKVDFVFDSSLSNPGSGPESGPEAVRRISHFQLFLETYVYFPRNLLRMLSTETSECHRRGTRL